MATSNSVAATIRQVCVADIHVLFRPECKCSDKNQRRTIKRTTMSRAMPSVLSCARIWSDPFWSDL